jgi:hypothetical protein
VKSATLIKTLTGLTTAMAVAAPFVVFGFLYVLRVQPERAAAAESRNELAAARAELSRRRASVTPTSGVTEVPALDTFDARTTEADRVGDVADALFALLNSPAVGGVSNLSIETGVPAEPPNGSMARLFSPTVVYTPVTAMFDARYEQIGRFFWNLRVLPTTFDLQSVELAPGIASRGGLMRAKVSLFVFHRPETTAPPAPALRTRMVDVVTAPEWTRDPFAMHSRPDVDRPVAVAQPAPVVSSILYSSGRRFAIVDGQIVRVGDRVRSGVVRSIERDAVVIAQASGVERRFALERPVIGMAKR